MGGLKEEVWGSDEVRLSNLSRLTPEMPSCPVLVKLFLQDNPTLTMIPPAFFENMPVLEVLDLSCTSLQCLPPSISKLVSLQEFILKDCSLLMELPPEIGALTSLKLFDIEGTEMMYLPQEIGKLENMECLRVSLSAYAAEYGERKGIAAIVPRMTISKLTRLKELSISVSPEAEWWEKEVSEAILEELHVLPDLQALKLYLPTAEVLQQFLQLQSYRAPIYERLLNFRLIIGPYEQLTCSLPPCFEESFEKLDRCLKYINGGGSIGDVAEIVRSARSLFLCRHWTIERLSMFDLDKLKCCVLSECNEMQNLVDGEELHSGKVVLGSLQYLGIHYMKKLESIWRGPISRGCLTCLRILSLHSCPKLTTVFSSCVLDNLGSLTELIVEDCPKISCLISLELGRLTRGPFLPSLKKLSLLDLPELVGMSSGLRIAPDLDTLLVFNCLKLNLDTMELPNGSMKEIKGEVEWWDGLNCDRSNWNSIFVGLTRDGCLMDQLAEDTNSLQHFLELQMISPHPGSSLQKDHNPLQGQQGPFGVSHLQALSQVAAQAAQVHTQTDIQAEYSSLSAPLASSSPSQVQSCISNTTTHQGIPLKPDHNTAKDSSDLSNSDDRFPSSSITIDKCADDGHNWRKYGQKQVKGSEYLRSYYRCTHPNCPVLKKVELSLEGLVTEIIYKGQRDNQPPQSKPGKDTGNGASGQSEQGFEGQTGSFNHSRDRMVVSTMTIEDQDSGQASHEQSGSGDSKEVCDDVSRVDERHEDEAEARNRSREIRASEPVSSNLTFTGPRVSFQTIREVDHLDDGYKWRKYGQKPVLGSPYPRSYYKCTRKGCKIRKYVKRSAGDPKTVITTYEGEHNHDGPTAKNSSHNTANSTASQVNPHTGACLDGISLTKRPEVPKDQQQPMGLLQFKERTDNITVEEWLDL